MTPGAPVAEDVFGQLAAMRVIPVVVLDDGALCCPSCRERNSLAPRLAPRLGSRSSKRALI